jgi:DNA-binding NarL/FixJ family response regulator
MAGTPQVRVLLVDDEPMFLEAVRALLEVDGRVDVVGVAGNCPEAVKLAFEERPDVALVDLALPGLDGFATTRLLLAQTPGLKVVVLSGLSDGTEAGAAHDAGATGFLFKGGLHEEIADAIVGAHSTA